VLDAAVVGVGQLDASGAAGDVVMVGVAGAGGEIKADGGLPSVTDGAAGNMAIADGVEGDAVAVAVLDEAAGDGETGDAGRDGGIFFTIGTLDQHGGAATVEGEFFDDDVSAGAAYFDEIDLGAGGGEDGGFSI
jgi:hypothetical protein